MTLPAPSQSSSPLADITALASLGSEVLRVIEAQCRWRRFKSAEPIFSYGSASDEVFFLVDGSARVVTYSDAGRIVSFRDLEAGDMFGELSVIDGAPRSASVEGRSDGSVACLAATDFRALLESEPAFAMSVLREQATTIRRLSTRVQEFSAAVQGITGRRIYAEVQGIRAKDIFPDEETKAHLVETSFPRDAQDMTLRLSNVTAAFYALMLKHVGLRFGWETVDPLSRRVFRELGRLKTREALGSGIELPRDARAPAVVFITAVHTASPEYNFDVFEYAPASTAVRVFGFSRYARLAKKLDIEEHIAWPELTPFFEGISEELAIPCRVEADLKDLGEEGRYDCIYRFSVP